MIRKLDCPIGTRFVIEVTESDLSCDECCFFGVCDVGGDEMCNECNRSDGKNTVYKLVEVKGVQE